MSWQGKWSCLQITFVLWRLITKPWPLFLKHTNFSVDRLNTLLFLKNLLTLTYKRFIVKCMADFPPVHHMHKQIKEFNIYRNKTVTPKQNSFDLMYSRYIDFPGELRTEKTFVSPWSFSDISNAFFDLFKIIHHPHVSREIYCYAYNFCNKKVRELTGKSEQYFSWIFHNGFRFGLKFLTKGMWLSRRQRQDVFLLVSALTTLKSYTLKSHTNKDLAMVQHIFLMTVVKYKLKTSFCHGCDSLNLFYEIDNLDFSLLGSKYSLRLRTEWGSFSWSYKILYL